MRLAWLHRRPERHAHRSAPKDTSFKTELIPDRISPHSRSQLELAIVEYLGWFNNARLRESLGDILPAELEQQHGSEPSN